MSKLNPGDLAMLTEPRNFGLTVELVSLHEGPCNVFISAFRYQEIPAGTIGWLVRGEGMICSDTFGCLDSVNELAFREKWLMPLRGDPGKSVRRTKELAA